MQVKMYMDSLPYGYPPIKDSDGELKRNKAYLMQMPPQDTDPDSWSKLTDVEKKRLVKISEKNKSRACGIGNLRIAVKKERKVKNNTSCCSTILFFFVTQCSITTFCLFIQTDLLYM